jgi:hypothetical protein
MMYKTMQIIIECDYTYRVNMEDKFFIVKLCPVTNSYKLTGQIPDRVKQAPNLFIDWFMVRLEKMIKTGVGLTTIN